MLLATRWRGLLTLKENRRSSLLPSRFMLAVVHRDDGYDEEYEDRRLFDVIPPNTLPKAVVVMPYYTVAKFLFYIISLSLPKQKIHVFISYIRYPMYMYIHYMCCSCQR